MAYKNDILNKLRDSDNWPCIPRPEFIQELNMLADTAYNKKTTEGYLASLLIYHQITEEMIRILIECSSFYLQLSIFPNKLKSRELRGKMFGQLIAELNQGVLDEDILRFIQKGRELNELRIRMVHKITLKTSIKDIAKQTHKVKSLFESINLIFDTSYDKYRVTFKDFKKNIKELEEITE